MEVLYARCAAAGRGGQVQCLGQVDEPDAEVLQFPERRQEIRDRPAPTIQPPDQHHVDLPPASGFQQFLSRFPSCRSGVHLTNLQGDRPSRPETFSPLFVTGQKR